MAINPGTLEYNVLLGLTITIVLIKSLLAVRLALVIRRNRRAQGNVTYDFLFAVLVFFLFAAASRVLYAVFDFHFTYFEVSRYADHAWWWKAATLCYQLGIAMLLWTLDKRILNNKFRGALAYIVLATGIVVFLYPVQTHADFSTMSSIVIVSGLVATLFPVLFFYVGWKNPPIRRNAWIIAFGAIVYFVGTSLVAEEFLTPLVNEFGAQLQVTFYILSTSLKTVGLLMLAYGTMLLKVGAKTPEQAGKANRRSEGNGDHEV